MYAPGAGHHVAARPLAEAPELALRQGTEDHHAFREAGRHRRCGMRNRRRAAATAAAPLHIGKAQIVDAERVGEARWIATVVGEGGEAVHLLGRDAGVFAGGDHRHQRQLELGIRRLAAFVVGGFADTDNSGGTTQSS